MPSPISSRKAPVTEEQRVLDLRRRAALGRGRGFGLPPPRRPAGCRCGEAGGSRRTGEGHPLGPCAGRGGGGPCGSRWAESRGAAGRRGEQGNRVAVLVGVAGRRPQGGVHLIRPAPNMLSTPVWAEVEGGRFHQPLDVVSRPAAGSPRRMAARPETKPAACEVPSRLM